MAQNETGHAKNAANFETILSKCISFGEQYKPSRSNISIDALQQKKNETNTALSALATATTALSMASANREAAFKPIPKLVTRIMNAVLASEVSNSVAGSVRSIVNKIQGRRASAILSDEEKKALEAEGKSSRQISASQTGFDNRLANFNLLIELLRAIPAYAPNETELSINSLVQLAENLKTLNTDVINADTLASGLRTSRNEVMYHPVTGTVSLAALVKVYVKSVFGSTSDQYRQLSALRFSYK